MSDCFALRARFYFHFNSAAFHFACNLIYCYGKHFYDPEPENWLKTFFIAGPQTETPITIPRPRKFVQSTFTNFYYQN